MTTYEITRARADEFIAARNATVSTLAPDGPETVHLLPRVLQSRVLRGHCCWFVAGTDRSARAPRLNLLGPDGQRTSKTVQRVAAEHLGAVLEPGQLVLTTCGEKGCVRPSHLFVGDHLESAWRTLHLGRCRPRGKQSTWIEPAPPHCQLTEF